MLCSKLQLGELFRISGCYVGCIEFCGCSWCGRVFCGVLDQQDEFKFLCTGFWIASPVLGDQILGKWRSFPFFCLRLFRLHWLETSGFPIQILCFYSYFYFLLFKIKIWTFTCGWFFSNSFLNSNGLFLFDHIFKDLFVIGVLEFHELHKLIWFWKFCLISKFGDG